MSSQTPAQFTPRHPVIRDYQRSLAELRAQGLSNELALRRPFANLLAGSARLLGWQLVEELAVAGQKIRRGYPVTNTIFEDTSRAILYQDRAPVFEADLSDAGHLADLLFRFYSH